MIEVREDIQELRETIYNHRKNLNKLAEQGFKEYKTSKYIRDYLDKLNIEYKTYLGTDVVGMIKGTNPSKNIAFRSDIDALVTEYGIKHLCGHDGHMSILLGFLEYLKNNEDKLKDNIIFIFQPAEEGPGGAEKLVEKNVLKEFEVDEIYGLHLYPEIEQGQIGVRSGYFLAQNGEINIDIKGKSGHGAMPQNTIDAIIIACDFVNRLQSIISRNISPVESAVLTFGKIEGGSVRNIIADTVRVEGTIRVFNPNVYSTIKDRIVEIAKGFEIGYNCEINVEIIDGYLAVNNDKRLVKKFKESLHEDIVIELEPLMISEDFSFYQKEVPGLFFMLGSRNKEKKYTSGLHNINFNFDEEILLYGIETYVNLLNSFESLD